MVGNVQIMAMKKSNLARSFLLATALAASALLSACASSSPLSASGARIDSALYAAADEAATAGNTEESLAVLESLYKRKSADPDTVLKYARALRNAGRTTRANLVLAPLGDDPKNKSADIKTEYASLKNSMGDYKAAETAARGAVLLDPESAQAYHLLGVALDAQGFHPQAELAFRKALDHWEGDPAPVLNNLGLCLAAQGFLDEAIESLRKASASSPDREEVERNLRIVSALRTTPPKEGMRLIPPKPPRRPENFEPPAAPAAAEDAPEIAPDPEKTDG